MTTPRTVVDENLPVTRIVVGGDLATERVVVEVEDQPGIIVSNTGEDITVSIYTSSAGVNSVNGFQGDVTLTTTNVAEGTNQYFTTQRARDSISAGNNITITNGVISTVTEPDFTTVTVTEAPSSGFYVTNKTYVDGAIASAVGAIDFPVDSVNGQTGTVVLDTDDIAEGSTNLYYTNARADARVAAGIAGIDYPVDSVNGKTNAVVLTTTDIAEGTNLYYTNARADARVAIGIANLVDSAPTTLDTLNELAAALGDDPNFASTITTALGNKLNTSDFTSTANTWLATKSTTNLAEGTNLYYTDARARASNSAGTGISYNPTTGVISCTITQSPITAVTDVTQVFAYATNADSVTITKGTPVYMYAATGNRVSVKRAYNTSDATSAKTMGLAYEDIAAGNPGYIITQGVIDGLNLGSYSEGDTLYLGATAGTLTNVKPYAPNHLVYIGVVERANNGNGQIYVKPQNGYELDEIHDVDLKTSTPTAGQVLRRNPANTLWVNETLDTDDIGEGATNQYFTTARARQSISGTGDISYDANTGVISYTGTGGIGAVASVNGQTGIVVLDSDDISEGTTNLYHTAARARSAVANGTDLIVSGNDVYVGSLRDSTRVLGSLQATTSTSYTFPAPNLNTTSNNNGIDAASSFANSNTFGNGAQGQFTHYYGDTLSGNNTAAVFSLRSANGNSVAGQTLPFNGLTSVAPSAVTTGGVLGGLNFNGYATSGFSDYVSTQNQGGGLAAIHALQVQAVPLETFADSALTISGATITAVSRINVAQTVTSVSGTRGQLTIPSTTAGVGTAVIVTGTLIGTATGISAGTYYIVANNGGGSPSTEITLSATVGGAPITTTPGTVTGLTFTRQGITVTYSAQGNIPFGLNAKIAVSGFTNASSGTFMAIGTSTATSVTIGVPTSGVPALSGSQSLSCQTVTAGGTSFRVRGFKAATPLNSATRTNFIDHGVATATYKSDQFTVQGGTNTYNYMGLNAAGATFNIGTLTLKDLTGVNTYATLGSTSASFNRPVAYPSYTTTQRDALTPMAGWVLWNSTLTKLQVYTGTAWADLH